jgi:hypothetical protein
MTVALSQAQLETLMAQRKAEIERVAEDLADLEQARNKYGSDLDGYYKKYKEALILEAQDLIGRYGIDGGPSCFLI